MDVTSDEIRSSRFQGTRHVYDRREVDAFLHRTAATLEVYERKLAVTQAHVESLEQALDLAHSRARSVHDREARIAELEAALAAAQHNYENAMNLLESAGQEGASELAEARAAAVSEAQRRAEELVEEAAREALSIRSEGERIRAKAETETAALLAAAEAAAAESRDMAHSEQAAMLDEIALARTEAKIALEAELAAKREAAAAEIEEERLRLAAEIEAAEEAKGADLQQAEARLAEAEKRAQQAEADLEELAVELEQIRSQGPDRERLRAEAETMVAEALADAEVERNRLLAEERADIERGRVGEATDASGEVLELRRQLSLMRTALANIQSRFANAAELSTEELQLATALIDLDLHDVDQLIDLTALEDQQPLAAGVPGHLEPDATSHPDSSESVRVKSKWASAEQLPAGSLSDGRQQRESGPSPEAKIPPWRQAKSKETVERPSKPELTGKPAAEQALGFYERRLAGLRERLKDAAPTED